MLLPRPKEHRQSYYGVLAANAILRKDVVPRTGLAIDKLPKVSRGDGGTQRSARCMYAVLVFCVGLLCSRYQKK